MSTPIPPNAVAEPRDPVDQLLAEDAARPVPDDGFTLRVMAALPPAARAAARAAMDAASRKVAIGVAAGSAAAGALTVATPSLWGALNEALNGAPVAFASLVLPAVVGMVVVVVWGVRES